MAEGSAARRTLTLRRGGARRKWGQEIEGSISDAGSGVVRNLLARVGGDEFEV